MLKLVLALLLAIGSSARAAETRLPAEVASHIPNAQVLASARFSFMLWQLYDATLYTAGPGRRLNAPFALRLDYLMNLSGRDIANRSAEEIRRTGRVDEITLAQWHGQLLDIIPDVKAGDSITGIADANLATYFYRNGHLIGVLRDPLFTTVFFNIWLGRNSSDQALRNQLFNTATTGDLPCAPNFCN